MHKLLALILSALILSIGTVQAEIYKWVDASGKIHFTDKPVHGSEQQNSRSISTISNPGFNLKKNSTQMKYTEHSGNMYVQGRVNGVAMQFMVDTGASYVSIPPEIAKRARINTNGVQQVTLQTANGKIKVPLILASNIEAGGVKQQNILSVIHRFSSDGKTGLLGMSFLSNFSMTIDQKRKLLLLEKK